MRSRVWVSGCLMLCMKALGCFGKVCIEAAVPGCNALGLRVQGHRVSAFGFTSQCSRSHVHSGSQSQGPRRFVRDFGFIGLCRRQSIFRG